MISARNRDLSRRKALRKRRIAREICGWEYYDNLHQYSKNKIHCSCGLCRAKTAINGNTITDQKKIDSCNNQLIDFYNFL